MLYKIHNDLTLNEKYFSKSRHYPQNLKRIKSHGGGSNDTTLKPVEMRSNDIIICLIFSKY